MLDMRSYSQTLILIGSIAVILLVVVIIRAIG